MKILHFRNEALLLEKMQDVEAVKKCKADFYFAPQHKIDWQNKALKGEAVETDFAETTICAIPITQKTNTDLFVIDCDNGRSVSFMLSAIERMKIDTLITKSPYGAHIYFIDTDPLPLKPIRQLDNINGLAIDFFNIKTHSAHLIIDGAGNPYYSVHNLAKPALINDDFKMWLKDTFELISTEQNISIFGRDNKIFKPNKSRWQNIIYPALQSGHLDIAVALKAFEYRRNDINYSQRNNTLNRFMGWAGVCGFFESYEQWVEFALIVNKSFAENGIFKQPLDESEIRATICNKSKWDLNYYTAQETAETMALNANAQQKRTLTNFLAFNLTATAAKNTYLHIFEMDGSIKILEILNSKILLRLCQTDGELSDTYLTKNEKGLDCVSLEKITPCKIMRMNNRELYSYDDSGTLIINPNALNCNPLVDDIIEGRDNIELLSYSEFLNLPFMRVFYQNLTPNVKIAEKILSDMSYCLKHNCGLVNVPLFWDAQGGCGKGLILNTMIDFFFFNQNYNKHSFENEYAMQIPSNAPRISVKTFVESRFNAEFNANAVILDEDGFNAKEARKFNKSFASKIKEFAKAEYIRIEGKNSNSFLKKNNVYLIRCLNSLINPIPKDESNTRLYVSKCKKIIGDDELTSIYNNKQKTMEDLPKILKYILHNFGNDAKQFSKLPKPDFVAEKETFNSEFKSFLKRTSSVAVLDDCLLLAEWLRLCFYERQTPNGVKLIYKDFVWDELIKLEGEGIGNIRLGEPTIRLLVRMGGDRYASVKEKYCLDVDKTYTAGELFVEWANTYVRLAVITPDVREECTTLLDIYGTQAYDDEGDENENINGTESD